MRGCVSALVIVGAVLFVILAAVPARAADEVHDEIQVYNAEIAELGQ